MTYAGPVAVPGRGEQSRILSLWMLAPAGANVVMQLARPEVARGVLDSPVPEGSLRERPWKRTRTTLTYVGLAAFGTDDERRALRRAVSHQHVRVRAEQPVAYSAFDPELQLWVGACMYVGLRDGYRALYGPVDEDTEERLYQVAQRFATTLQVGPEEWPPTRVAMEEYWTSMTPHLSFDEDARRFCDDLVHLRFWPSPVSRLVGDLHARWSVGYLDPQIRAILGWRWTQDDAAWFERAQRRARRVASAVPAVMWSLPLRALVAHGRWRIRRGQLFTD